MVRTKDIIDPMIRFYDMDVIKSIFLCLMDSQMRMSGMSTSTSTGRWGCAEPSTITESS